jgi:hypothetical protein
MAPAMPLLTGNKRCQRSLGLLTERRYRLTAVGVSKAKELGIKDLAMPTYGNASIAANLAA